MRFKMNWGIHHEQLMPLFVEFSYVRKGLFYLIRVAGK